MFETTVLPATERFARKVFRGNDELVSLAIVLAWWAWSHRKADLPASVFARVGVGHAMQGRDLPGMQTKATDVWRKLDCWGGGGMLGMADPRPGPAKHAEQKELLALLLDNLDGRYLEMSERLMDGDKPPEIAVDFNVTTPRIYQMRERAAKRLAELE